MTPEEAIKEFRNTPMQFVRNPPKPIVVIKTDLEIITHQGDYSTVLFELTDSISKKMPDYHVFVIPQYDHSEPHDIFEFQVFYEKDHQPISYEELKEILLQQIPNQITTKD